MSTVTVLDGVLGALILACAWLATLPRAPLRAVIVYMVFGLAVTLSWVRLAAWDVALAEAAIGAGLSGLLLLKAYTRLKGRQA